jgi:hypothetical protein
LLRQIARCQIVDHGHRHVGAARDTRDSHREHLRAAEKMLDHIAVHSRQDLCLRLAQSALELGHHARRHLLASERLPDRSQDRRA